MALPASSPGGWRPALLSGLVFPGLGQAVAGRPWRALLFSGASLALIVAVVLRVIHETRRLMPTDPDGLLDPTLPLTLVAEIHRANASFFLWATLGIVALWVGAVVDCIPRGAVGPAPRESDPSRRRSATRRPGSEG